MIKPLAAIAVVVLIVLFASQTILGQFPSLHIIGNKGKVRVFGVGVYFDASCSSPVDYLDWGNVEPNSVKNITVFIRNEGNEPSSLFLVPDNWHPSNASDCMTLKWDYNERTIQPYETIQVTLTLLIASVPQGIKDFSFDIKIGVN
jgi:hypothetical protein